MYSTIIRNGTIYDGSGKPPEQADIAIQDGKIVYIGQTLNSPAHKFIDATGLAVAPGFIDIHSHTDLSIFLNPLADSKLLQGVTTEVTGNCGIGFFPVNQNRKNELESYLKMHGTTLPGVGITWGSFEEYSQVLNQIGIGLNIAPLVGHSILRMAVMGSDNRVPSKGELAEMKRLLSESLKQGAWGLSTGLVYPPSSFGQTEELIELAKVLASLDALFTSHVRNESETLLESIDEVIRIGEESGARVQVSHLKAIGKPNWGKGKLALDKIKAASRKGVNIGADQYPYAASSTALTVVVPAWAHDGGVNALLERLANPELREKLQQEIGKEVNARGGPERIMIASVSSARNASLTGKNIAEIASMWQCGEEDAIVRLLLEEEAAVSAVYFSISPDDMEYILSSSMVAVGSDGMGMSVEKNSGKVAHPRSYGTFSRVLGKFVREKQIMTLETAIYKMTRLPAVRLQLFDRGLVKVGAVADLTLFDPNTVSDAADFTNPHKYSLGIKHVLVNGQLAVEDGKLTGVAAGCVLRRNQTPLAPTN